jgi:hypothetical protein
MSRVRRPFLNPGNAMSERLSPADLIRFLAFIELDDRGCWLWTGAMDENGYGVFKAGGKSLRANRVSYVNFKCPLRHGNDVHHIRQCKSTSCVFPEHLRQKTRQWNSEDGARRRWTVKRVTVGSREGRNTVLKWRYGFGGEFGLRFSGQGLAGCGRCSWIPKLQVLSSWVVSG